MQYQRLLVQNVVFDRILSRLFSRVFYRLLSLSRRTPTSPILLKGIYQSRRSEDHLVEATENCSMEDLSVTVSHMEIVTQGIISNAC